MNKDNLSLCLEPHNFYVFRLLMDLQVIWMSAYITLGFQSFMKGEYHLHFFYIFVNKTVKT